MEFLTLDEIQRQRAGIELELSRLLATKAVVGRPSSQQWSLFRACFDCLFRESTRARYVGLRDEAATPHTFEDLLTRSPSKSAQLKFEVEDRLQRYYQRPGSKVEFVFSLEHASRLHLYGLVADSPYPAIAGYSLLIRKTGQGGNDTNLADAENLAQYLERIVTECVDAEFRAYQALPEIKVEELERWFVRDSPAYSEIVNVLIRHRSKGWVISNQFNPSTKRLMDLRVEPRKKEGEQVVKTREYWYLKWYNSVESSYSYVYRETNRQLYILQQQDGEWKVYQNVRPRPRTSIPLRWSRKQRP